jgi:hypothetical protein
LPLSHSEFCSRCEARPHFHKLTSSHEQHRDLKRSFYVHCNIRIFKVLMLGKPLYRDNGHVYSDDLVCWPRQRHRAHSAADSLALPQTPYTEALNQPREGDGGMHRASLQCRRRLCEWRRWRASTATLLSSPVPPHHLLKLRVASPLRIIPSPLHPLQKSSRDPSWLQS